MKNIVTHAIFLATLATLGTACIVESADDAEAAAEQVGTEAEAKAAPGIEPALIQAAMRRDAMPGAKACYERVIAEEPRAGGRIAIRFVIRGGAAEAIEVAHVEGDLARDDFDACLETAMESVAFPGADGDVTVSYPLVFSNDG